MAEWFDGFFDHEYIYLWEESESAGEANRQAAGLWSILDLRPQASILDAPCGYGRISAALAERGARVVGVDLSHVMIAEAERRRGVIAREQLIYLQHDLRHPLEQSSFDVALNLFSSLGYGSEDDDLLVLRNLRSAVRPGGQLFVEVTHRDREVANFLEHQSGASRLPDGTLFLREAQFDPVAGRVESTWYWSGPRGSGQKRSSMRVYTATELIRLIEQSGLKVESLHRGCFPQPFATPVPTLTNRLGILARRTD
jgi:SAM-dependent methyltransferase